MDAGTPLRSAKIARKSVDPKTSAYLSRLGSVRRASDAFRYSRGLIKNKHVYDPIHSNEPEDDDENYPGSGPFPLEVGRLTRS